MPSLPSGAHIVGGKNAAAVHKEEAAAYYDEIRPAVLRLAQQGLSLRRIGEELARLGILPRRGEEWSASQVRRAVMRCTEPKAMVPAVGGLPVKVQDAIALPAPTPETKPAPPPSAKIMLSVKGSVVGPFTEEQIAEKLRVNEISLVTPFRLVNGTGWQPLMNLERPAK